MCKASIIIPAYNAAPFIAKTIESVLAQTFSDFECIIVDDGSKDETVNVVQQFPDPRISVISIANSGGPARPRNAGLAAAKGEYIFMFDSDDIMHPQKLELSIRALDKYLDADILFTNFASIDEQDEIIKADFLDEYDTLWNILDGRPNQESVVEIASDKIYTALVKVNFIGTSSVALRRSALAKNDVFNEDLKNSDDRLFWILFTQHHHALYINAVLHQYRIQANSISKQGFARRAPSKIKGLTIALHACPDNELKKIIKSQISSDYLVFARALVINGETGSVVAALRSALKYRFSLKNILAAGKIIVKLMIRPTHGKK